MMPNVNLGAGEIRFIVMVYTFLKNNPSPGGGGYKFEAFALLDFCFARRHIRFLDF